MTKNKILKVIRNILIVLIVLVLGLFIFWKTASSSTKMNLIKEFSKYPWVRSLIESQFGDDYGKIQDTDFNEDDVEINEGITSNLDLHGYTNLVLFGLDTRKDNFDTGTRSDSIIIVSINNDTNEIKMASVYRDTMLRYYYNDTVYYGKANAGYATGGVTGAISMLNTNLDLDIKDYICVNFSGLSDIINMLGGIDVNITEQERKYLNSYLTDMAKESKLVTDPVESAGDVHLDGLQATAFCRIRYTPFYSPDGETYYFDFGRTARQRFVIGQLVSKAKKLGVTELMDVARKVMSLNTDKKTFIRTSLTYNEIMDLIPAMIDYNLVDNTGFPFTLETPDLNGGDYVVACGLSYNVSELHKFLFNEEDYVPSETVSSISNYILNYTGVLEKHIPEETEETESESETESAAY